MELKVLLVVVALLIGAVSGVVTVKVERRRGRDTRFGTVGAGAMVFALVSMLVLWTFLYLGLLSRV